jgi:hypothetical protein
VQAPALDGGVVKARHAALREWHAEVCRLAAGDLHPFDGRRAKHLLAFAVDLGWSSTWRTGRAATLTAVRAHYGARMTRRYVEVLVAADLLLMTRRPARVRDGVGRGRAAEYALTLPQESPIAAPKPVPKGAAITRAERGTDNGDSDPEVGPSSPLSLPLSEHGSDTPSVPGARSSASALTLDVDKLVRLASRSQDWAGWQSVASLVRVA